MIERWKQVERRTLHRLALLSASLLLLTACPSPGPDCVYADDWGQLQRITAVIDPKDKFTDSSIEVRVGEPLYMKTSGRIDLCPDGEVFTETSPVGREIRPTEERWQNSGVPVREGEPLEIMIGEDYTDRNGLQTEGRGLYAMIYPVGGATKNCNGTGAAAPDDPNNAGRNDRMWWPSSNGAERYRTIDPAPDFFELWDNGSLDDDVSGFSGVGPAGLGDGGGCLWFKYARTADARSVDNSGTGRQSPWHGRYAWDDVRCNACITADIGCSPSSLSPSSIAFCIAKGICINGGYLSPNSHNCEESYYPIPPGGDHWVDEGYGGNGGGYEITVGMGCPGDKGMYMEALFASNAHITTTMQDLYAYPDGTACEPPACARAGTCTQNTTACTLQYDDSGAPARMPTYDLSGIPGTMPYTMSMDPALNSNINSRGEYGSSNFYQYVRPTSSPPTNQSVPRSGKLWFKIVDNMVKPSDAHSTHPTLANCEVPAGCMVTPGPTSAAVCTDVSACVPPSNSVADQYHIPWGVRYNDNVGEYKVKIITTGVDDGFSSFLNSLVTPIKEILFGVCTAQPDLTQTQCLATYTSAGWRGGISERLYNQLAGFTAGGGNSFIDALRAAILLYIIVYGFMFGLGMIQDVQTDFVGRVFRLAIVAQLLNPGSWEFFYSHLFTFFVDGMDELIAIMAADFMGAVANTLQDPITGNVVNDAGGNPVVIGVENPFTFVDQTVSQFFSKETMIKISGLLFASPIGWLYIILIFVGMYYYVFAILKGLIIYLLAMIAISLLLAVAPIFIAFLLFKKTRDLFNSWIKQLMNFLAQPVLVFTALSIFNVFVYAAIYTLLHYDVCWQCLLRLRIDPEILPVISMCLFKFYAPWGGASLSNIPMGFFMILIFMIICNAMLKLNDRMADLAAELTSGTLSTSLAKTASQTLASLTAGAGEALQMAKGVAAKGFDKAKQKMKGKRPGGPQK